MDRKIVFCTQLIDDLVREVIRPEYIVFDQFQCSDEDVKGKQCFGLCHAAILKLEKDGHKLYTVEREYHDIHVASEETRDNWIIVVNHPTYLYKLNSALAPI